MPQHKPITKYLALIYNAGKVRLGFLIMACALAGIAVSPSTNLNGLEIFALAVYVLVASSASGAFNQWYERDIDAVMERTKDRPFVTKELSPTKLWNLWLIIISLLALYATYKVSNLEAAIYLFAGIFTYGIVYTVWLKRRTWMNIVIGGLAGSFAVLVGSAAAGNTFAMGPLILSVVLFLWTPPHFWALAIGYKEEYAKANIPMLPVVVGNKITSQAIFWHTLVLVLLSLSLILYKMSWIYFIFALSGGSYFLYCSFLLLKDQSKALARKTFFASIFHLGLLLLGTMFDAMIFD
ncbi:MAG: protoheme IX farnesyltransferase [Gammaproteobacteria bacterium]|jgi:protoheme IX farnesyltransferase|nr:protoheme IX farnesyltransferase [Gammaproteobacteria bacterium]MBT6074530.1 protoheme IX farnesyltransferase [Gammaproteobacteria bacterium]MBT7753823.1 protoheme IX farnesyltransferase [Gammaproteobacteria bacterium]MDG2435330.1 heme o synthase [Gammaproteobacteria bacterium]